MDDYNLQISMEIKERLSSFKHKPRIYYYGEVTSCADGVVLCQGLSQCRYGELLEFETPAGEAYGIAMNMDTNHVGAVLLNGIEDTRAGTLVKGTGHVLEIPVGNRYLGRVVDPIGRPLDGEGPIRFQDVRPIECEAPSIIQRSSVNTPLQTGILAIDSMIPIGRGQRELIIGDRQTGKTAIAIDAIINQKNENVVCIYAAIGQKASSVSKIVRDLDRAGALEHTVVMVSTASDCAAMQYITPYSACAIAEDFMYNGRDVLIVYDDLSKHAVAYRAISLLLRRPPGREAYPGDVFYLHSRLLERAAKLSPECGGGSITALPIVETLSGDISAYIPTNIISITDGQIFLESELFHAGLRPAINVGLSVSRVGGAAQRGIMRRAVGSLRLNLAQYRELSVFSQFDSDLDINTKNTLAQGEKLVLTLKQPQYVHYSLAEQVVLLYAASSPLTRNIPVSEMTNYNSGLLSFMRKSMQALMGELSRIGTLDEETKERLDTAIQMYNSSLQRIGDAK